MGELKKMSEFQPFRLAFWGFLYMIAATDVATISQGTGKPVPINGLSQ